MKIKFLIMISVLIISFFKAQDSVRLNTSRTKMIGFSPSRNVENVNGILIKYFDDVDNFHPKKVNGLGIGFNFIGIFYPPLFLFNLPDINKWNFENSAIAPGDRMNKINGMQLSIINLEPTITNGVGINISGNINTYAITNGVAISPFLNIHQEMNGASVATFAHVGKKCRGIQVGIFNKCGNFKGVQIGLWNENGKRKLPLINWNFKAEED
ncbi:LA_2272 family surface repeat-containing protein [Chryseobacterium sp. CT-SW4]|uniref:LA_2272 family surface repeat-containing protein n=1 Tax=Chryseobacterium sp. SW-1 TaxID=3157343 RepID=UPI003B0203EB